MTSLSTLSLERLKTMKKGQVIIWNGKPHTFVDYVMSSETYNGRDQMYALLEEKVDKIHMRYFSVFVKDAFNKMENQILTTI